jgi:hypothetical protein
MSQSFKVIFYLKKGKGRREGVLPVYVRLTVDGKRIEWSVQQSCEKLNGISKSGECMAQRKKPKS